MIRTDSEATAFQGESDPVTDRVLRVFYEVYNELEFGFLESVYREAMRVALSQAGFRVETEMNIQVQFRGEVIGIFRADLIVDGVVLLELKTVEQLNKAHEAQVLNYLRATILEVGLLLNFGAVPRVRRLEMRNNRKISEVR